jgi:hypothetical protein
MQITPDTYFKLAEISLPHATVARIKKMSNKIDLDIEKHLRRQVMQALEALPDHREYRVEFGELLKMPSTRENYINYRLPCFVYLTHPEEAEVGEVVHPDFFKSMLDDMESDDILKTTSGKKFGAVMDIHLFKISPVIDKASAIKYFRRVE